MNLEEIIKVFIQDGRLDPSFDNNGALRLASQNGYINIVKLLLHSLGRQSPRKTGNSLGIGSVMLTISFKTKNVTQKQMGVKLPPSILTGKAVTIDGNLSTLFLLN